MLMLFVSAVIIVSVAVLMLNLYGQFKSLRFSDFDSVPESQFRFGRKLPLSYREAKAKLKALMEVEDPLDYAQRATKLVSECLAHLEWYELDPLRSYQTVPIWENPILYILGRYSRLPYYQRYNFTDYRKTLERGFGICGDASTVLSQLLDKKSIKHQIVAFDEHVLVEAEIESKLYMLDPDFGLATNHSVEELSRQPGLTASYYRNAGFTDADGKVINIIMARPSYRYKSVYNFVPKRYLLERVSYWLFWTGPLFGIILAWLLWV